LSPPLDPLPTPEPPTHHVRRRVHDGGESTPDLLRNQLTRRTPPTTRCAATIFPTDPQEYDFDYDDDDDGMDDDGGDEENQYYRAKGELDTVRGS
jgi:hypothetical protein